MRIDPNGPDGRFRVDVLRSPDGSDASAMTKLDADSLLAQRQAIESAVLNSTLALGTSALIEEERVRAAGQELFGALLGSGAIAERYRAAEAVAGMDSEELRIMLRTTDPALAALPWEAMYDHAADRYVCQQHQLVRHVGVLFGVPPLAVEPPLRVLGIVSSPYDLPSLDVAKEQSQLANIFDQMSDSQAELTWAPAATWTGLQDILLRESWHIVHFIGHGGFDHGRGEGVLGLADERGMAAMVEASRLVSLLREAKPMPRLVMLNSCSGATASTANQFSSTAAALVRGGVRAVTAMQYEISDTAAVAFSRGFYSALARDRGIDEAVSSGRVAIMGLPGRPLEWITPVLYHSGHDSRLFIVQQAAGTADESLRQRLAGPGKSGDGAGSRVTGHGVTADLAVPARPVLAIPAHEEGALCVAFAPRADAGRAGLLASAGADGTVRLWNAARPSSAARRPAIWAHAEPAGPTVSLALYPDGTAVAAGWTDGPVHLMPIFARDGQPPGDRLLTGHAGAVTAMAFAPHGELLVTAGEDEQVLLHYLAEHKPYHLPGWRSGMAQALAVSPDGEWLAAAGADQTVRVWSVATWEQRQALAGHTGEVRSLAFSPDSGFLASAGADGSVRIWDAAAGHAEHVFSGDFRQAWSVAFYPGGGLLAGATDDRVTFWRPATGTRPTRHLDNQSLVLDIAFSHDGALLASASQDGMVRVWDVSQELHVHSG